MHILLIGCGDIGIPLGQQLLLAGHQVTGLRRQAEKLPNNFAKLAVDVCDASSCQQLASLQADAVVITLSPNGFTDAAYQQTYLHSLQNLLPIWQRQTSRPHVYFISSTSVYQQNQGQWVDENSPTEPQSFAGKRLLQAEQLVSRSGLSYSLIRFAGIYGPGRFRLLQKIQSGQASPSQPRQWTNRIHRDDCVGFLAHLLGQQAQGQIAAACYIGCDSLPCPVADIEQWLAQQLGVELQPGNHLITRSGNKRCSNQRLLDSGYKLHYPSFKHGYMSLLVDLGQ